ncbi:RNA polymerase subunit sigma-70, partial [Streptomyces massasporeus]
MLRGRPRRVPEAHAATGDDPGGGADPLDAAQERRVRAVLALGGVPQADLPDGVQQV